MKTILEHIYLNNMLTPEKMAVIGIDISVNYRKFWKYITNLSLILKKYIKKNDKVLIEASPTVEFLVCHFAVQLAGGISVPVEKNISELRLQSISSELCSKLNLIGKHPLLSIEYSLSDLDIVKEITDNKNLFSQLGDFQEILFTSGTTGSPKPVLISYENQEFMSVVANRVLSLKKDDVWLIPTPFNHGGALRRFYTVMVNGSTAVLIDGFFDISLFFKKLVDYNVTSIFLPPAAVRILLSLASDEFSKFNNQLDFFFFIGERLDISDKKKLNELLPLVRKFDVFSTTEAGDISILQYDNINSESNSVGKLFPFVTLNNSYVHSPFVAYGYSNQPFNSEFLLSDIIKVKNDVVYLYGRADDVVNINGLKVSLSEIESTALQIKGIFDASCICIKNDIKPILKLFVIKKQNTDISSSVIYSYLRNRLEFYKLPNEIIFVDSFPKTLNGKIDKKKLGKEA